MLTNVPPGKYILAVSGGVDSMALLDMLSNLPDVELIIAHFNHGIRDDSIDDEELVRSAAKNYGLPLEIGQAKLGSEASEATAREARYNFLYKTKDKYCAEAIITAHHQDDLIETAFINLLRGTGRRGLSAIAQNSDIVRPLLDTPKAELIVYARKNDLKWREDKTNDDTRILRNYIRKNITPKLTQRQRQKILANIENLRKVNPILDMEIATMSQEIIGGNRINRRKFIDLPPAIADEVLAYWLRGLVDEPYDKKIIIRLSNAIKTARTDTRHDVAGGFEIEVGQKSVLLTQGVKS